MQELNLSQINTFLASYEIPAIKGFELIDSSHGEEDVRHNYILDRRYVLRVNSAPVFTEQRLSELNRLIDRYRDFGLKSPLFLSDKNGKYLQEIDGCYAYLSEYLDLPLADDREEKRKLIGERLSFVARFAQRYRGVDLVDTRSMYSLFELSPYDELTGVNEKQDNLNELSAALRKWGYDGLADRLNQRNEELRSQLRSIYRELPRCVFQGDENFSNLCLDEAGHIAGIFDFNMSGTEVIANYLANLAFQARINFLDNCFDENSPEQVFAEIADVFRDSTAQIQQHYAFSEPEKQAYFRYAELVLLSGNAIVSALTQHLECEKTREKAAALLQKIMETSLK